MPMNEQKGNMYEFISHTWNPIRGECHHECAYCYMKGRFGGPLRLDQKEVKTDLRENNIIFVGSSTDMWATNVPHDWILKVLEHCNKYPDNTYIFQTKNPHRFNDTLFIGKYPPWTMLGTTIESNRTYGGTKAPGPFARAVDMFSARTRCAKTFVTIEPIMDFDLADMVHVIGTARPDKVFIGADSKGHHLPEPTAEKILSLEALLKRKSIEVIRKPNLNRLLKEA